MYWMDMRKNAPNQDGFIVLLNQPNAKKPYPSFGKYEGGVYYGDSLEHAKNWCFIPYSTFRVCTPATSPDANAIEHDYVLIKIEAKTQIKGLPRTGFVKTWTNDALFIAKYDSQRKKFIILNGENEHAAEIDAVLCGGNPPIWWTGLPDLPVNLQNEAEKQARDAQKVIERYMADRRIQQEKELYSV